MTPDPGDRITVHPTHDDDRDPVTLTVDRVTMNGNLWASDGDYLYYVNVTTGKTMRTFPDRMRETLWYSGEVEVA